MLRKFAPLLAAGLVFILLLSGYLLRPVTLWDNNETRTLRPAAFTTGQALRAAGKSLDPQDQVEPGLYQWIPLNGQIHIRRALQVFLWENGKVRPISGFESSPAALLEQNRIHLGPGDRLLWDGLPVEGETVLPAGKPLVLQLVRAQTVILDNNGKRQALAVSTAAGAPTAARALWEAGIHLSPSDRLSVIAGSLLEPNQILGYLPARPLVIRVSGKTIQARSGAETVGQALAEAGLALQGLDYSQPAEDQPLPQNGQVRVVHVREETSLKETLVPYEHKFAADSNVELDQRRITQAGQYGVKVVRERVRLEDGKEISRGHDSDWIASEPVAQVTGYGTKVSTKTADTPGGKIEYWRAVRVYATSYSPCNQGYPDGRCSDETASGMRLTKGVIGVSLSWFRAMQGQRVYVENYGFGTIGDYGAVSGMWIDLGFDEESFKQQAFVGWTTMYFLTPVPANIPWTLP